MAPPGSESRSRRTSAKPEAPDLRCRIALRIPEAAAALGCSESTLRRMLPELDGCVFKAGRTPLISIEGLQRWCLRQAELDDQQAESEAIGIMEEFENSEKE
jgi:hypothetical protein